MAEFKVGDRVRRTKAWRYPEYPEGYEFTIVRINGTDSAEDDRGMRHDTDNLELVEEDNVTETFDRYDKRMRPLFTRLAQEAEDLGYCDEFDHLAATLGFPSRADLLGTPQQRAWNALPIGAKFVFSDDRSGPAKVKVSEGEFYAPGGSLIGGLLNTIKWHLQGTYTVEEVK